MDISSGGFLNLAFYGFFAINNPEETRSQLRIASSGFSSLKGNLIVSAEGINAYFAGLDLEARAFFKIVSSLSGFPEIKPKESWSQEIPFRKLNIKVKSETIGVGEPDLNPADDTAPHLDPLEFKRWMDERKEDFLVVDTRNDYEVKVGTFEGAINPNISHFKEFPEWVRQNLAHDKKRTIVTFCTGGIRCEKATALMRREGFENVYQIDGGILNYLEKTIDCKESNHWQGDCFVFDHRVAVDKSLNPTGRRICFGCWHVLTEDDKKHQHYLNGETCPYCYQEKQEKKRLARELTARKRAERLRISREKGELAKSQYLEKFRNPILADPEVAP